MLQKKLFILLPLLTVFLFSTGTHAAGAKFKFIAWPSIKIWHETTDNVYQDYSMYPDITSNFNLTFRTNISVTPIIYSWWDYQLYLKKYVDWDFFDYSYQSLNGRINKDLGNWGGLEILLGYQSYNQPNSTYYDFNTVYAYPGIKYYVTDYTILTCSYLYSNTDYPNYVLGYNAAGYSSDLTQEFSLFTKIKIDYSYKKRVYPKWHIIIDTTGVQSPDTQVADEISAGLTYSYRTNTSDLTLYYSYSSFDSNATFLDYGPDMKFGTGDEILVNNYYYNTSGEYGLGFQYDLSKKLTPYIQCSTKETVYTHRLARDNNNMFLNENRKDNNFYYKLDLSYLVARLETMKLDITASYSRETNNSNDYFYNYTNTVTKLSVNCKF
jgi:hypothetical protein